jgi:phosphoribosylaminoimidazolecarboxamide formyltransferase/IMP cyclohydrolase
VDIATAEEIGKIFVEIVIAPAFDKDALEYLSQKKNIRLLELPLIAEPQAAGGIDIKKVDGGILIQDVDGEVFDEGELRVVTEKQPTPEQLADMKFGMKVVKHVKSNAIVIAKDGMTLGIGPGQTNRIGAARIAIAGPDREEGPHDLAGAVMASDAFFPFPDCVEAAAAAGITAIIQPGGSMKDEESIARCNELGIAMVFSGVRHFKH